MDGLECCEVTYKRTLSETSYFRLEAEYYNAGTIAFSKLLKGIDITLYTQYGTSKFCDEEYSDYPVLRLNELDNGFISEPQKFCHILTLSEFENLRLRKGEVLIIRTNGNPNLVGRAAVIEEDTNIAFASYLFRVILNGRVNAESLVSFLNGKYGRIEIDKHSMKGNQTNFSPAKFLDITIPDFSPRLQEQIRICVNNAYEFRKQSKTIYSEAEHALIMALFPSSISHVINYAEKSFSTSFGVTGRLDAEYYQPKYDELYTSLHTSDTVHSLCVLHDCNFIPNRKQKYTYIELADVGQMGEISGADPVYGAELPTRARRRVEAGQVIISSIEGSLQSCALITDEFNGALCSTGFYILTSENLNPETLLVLFKSEPIQALMKQRCSGTILTAISKDELLSMPLPKIDNKVQEVIAEKIQGSFFLRHQSKQLLENAKHAVEMAIEQGEDKAMRWLQEQGEI